MNGNKYLDIIFSKPLLLVFFVVISIVLESITAFDRFVQQAFYMDGSWLISSSFHQEYRWLLYTGVKVFVAVVAVIVLGVFLYTFFNRKRVACPVWVKPSLMVVISITLVPFLISSLKLFTGVYGPKSLIQYGGEYEHIGFIVQLFTHGHVAGGRCFPAGHASGGFALMCLYFLPLSVRWRTTLFYFGMALGWFMGLYQMARGEHFVSHTLTTMFIALAMIAYLAKVLRVGR